MSFQRKVPGLKFWFYGGYLLLALFVMSSYLDERSPSTFFWFKGLLVILFPWSLVTGIAIVGTMFHGGNEGIEAMTIVTALLNIITVHFLIRWITPDDKNSEEDTRPS